MDQGKVPLNIFIDLSSAFDTIDHGILLSKLESYGFNNISLQLIQSYLSNRKQYVQFDESISSLLPIFTGVPQGSILGPLLFIIYVNDISACSKKFNFITYADDTTLIITMRNDIQHHCLINEELSKVYTWL